MKPQQEILNAIDVLSRYLDCLTRAKKEHESNIVIEKINKLITELK